MIYQFEGIELDLATAELRAAGTVCNLEPQVFALLAFLVENRDRLVSKDELIERVWDGRSVTDAAVSSRVKSARRAIGDDGRGQRLIRTIHRRGFRFVGPVTVTSGRGAPGFHELDEAHDNRGLEAAARTMDSVLRPSLAVLPFRMIGEVGRYAALSTGLPDELIAELARLRWLLVTARGSSFRLKPPDVEFGEIGRLLRVRYCLCGTIEVSEPRLDVTVELVDAPDSSVVWAERFAGRVDDVHAIRTEICAQVLAALEIRIPIHEAARARGVAVENLDAWSAYHLGLQHLYRFNRRDDAASSELFRRAVTLDANFARAHAGLSFAHFQTAFMHYSNDITAEIGRARRCAERGLELDPLDPFVNFTMGRTFWLEGDLNSSLSWLERATSISPHYAQGIYAQAWSETMAGRALDGRRHVELAMRLSPLDPLYYAMLGTRAFTHLVRGEDQDAARWAERAARSPGAHVLIAMIAAAASALSGDLARAESWAANVRSRHDSLNRDDFIRAFPFQIEATRRRVLQALTQLGF